MPHLHEALAARVAEWRGTGYAHQARPAIAEILDYQVDPETGMCRFLRAPQFQALETYWYLRLVQDTPHILELYRELFPAATDLLDALGLRQDKLRNLALDHGVDALFDAIRTDDDLVRDLKLEAVRETLTLDYPSYILALAMGAGKTILIGAIIATEFAMAQEYPDGDFIQNALVFAPGKTILEALRELADVPYDRVLPPRMYPGFAATVKLTFTRDGDPDIPVVWGSTFNVVVTNTGKIRIRKEAIRKSEVGSLFVGADEEEAKENVANLRLQRIASLPHLGVFSDEAHHTYGNKLLGRWVKDRESGERVFRESGIKKVRMTVDYLADRTNLICVVNTTGTPYFQKQPLRDVVIWYGLSEGIREGILKDVEDNIVAYSFDDRDADQLVTEIVTDFFERYGDVRLPNGAPARLALYFPKTDDLAELRPAVEAALAGVGQSPVTVLVNTSKSSKAQIDAFNRLNDPASPHRVIMLVNKGTEGWNCPSLFATALVRKLKSSNNFVLQAATRCLRQVPGNDQPARIYLSMDNRGVLDRQLQETYGESLKDLEHTSRERRTARLVLRKYRMPPLVVKRTVKRVVREEGPTEEGPLTLARPVVKKREITRTALHLADARANARVLRALGDAVVVEAEEDALDVRSAAVELSANHHLDVWDVLTALRAVYDGEDVPANHLAPLSRQIQERTGRYRTEEEEVEQAMALVRLDPHTGAPDSRGWTRDVDEDGEPIYTADITYFKDRETYLLDVGDFRQNPAGLGFHYTPYDFDSKPEQDFFVGMLRELGQNPEDVEDLYFTGALTDPNKTEFFVEYKDDRGRWRRYSPDFVLRRTDGRTIIVEIKAERDRTNPISGERGSKAMALRRWEDLDPERLRYEMIFTSTDAVAMDDVQRVIEKAGLQREPTSLRPIDLPQDTLREFCEKWGIARLEVFGSVARGEDRLDSDVDLLVTFEPDADPGWEIIDLEQEISELLGRSVDLVERKAIEDSDNPFRKHSILRDATRVYPA